MNDRSYCTISSESDRALLLRVLGLVPQSMNNAELHTARRLRIALLVGPCALCLHRLFRIYCDLRILSRGNLRLMRIESQTQGEYGKAFFVRATIFQEIS